MKRGDTQRPNQGLMRTQSIMLDVRECVLGEINVMVDVPMAEILDGEKKKAVVQRPLTLSGFCRLVNSDPACERIHEAVIMLIEARKNNSNQVKQCRESLAAAFEDARRWVHQPATLPIVDKMAVHVDEAIVASITQRKIQQLQYGGMPGGGGRAA